MTYFEVKNSIKHALLPISGEYAEYEAEKAVLFLYDIDKLTLTLRYREEAPDKSTEADDIIARRKNGEPLAYILGKVDFYGQEFLVSPACLTPRPDTEVICERALSLLEGKQSAVALDICTGSGCIALTLAKYGGALVDALDISADALDIAEKNACALSLTEKTRFFMCDIFSDSILTLGKRYDLIVSNPPYISTGDIEALSAEVHCEPHIALDGGDDGLVFYRRIISLLPLLLKEGGACVLEFGFDQKEALRALFERNGMEYEFFRDYGGNDRGACVRLAPGK